MIETLLPIFIAIAIGVAALIIDVLLVDDDYYGDDDE